MEDMRNGKIDVVYTWVDDSFEGYQAQLKAHATDERETNPNRTRDNLDILKFSLRSIHRYIPNVGQIFLLTCRPQVPGWLRVDHPQVTLVHHDQIIDEGLLPTFNSFCIVSHLHLLLGLSDKFLYFEDDMLVLQNGLEIALFLPQHEKALALFALT